MANREPSKPVMLEVVSIVKIASNSSMDNNLTHNLDAILKNLPAEEIRSGLSPLCPRLAKLFGKGSSQAIDQKIYPFCLQYIQQIPDLCQSLLTTGRDLGLETLLKTYIGFSSRYLASACNEIEQENNPLGLAQFLILLQGAYIFNRMLEELDDKAEIFIGVPINDLNMMDANLVVHEILGDNFANRLDKIVVSLVKQSLVSKSVIEAGLDQHHISIAKKEHKSLSGGAVVNFAETHGMGMLSGIQ
ncbi:MAG: hypothetical protein ACI82A_000548 [Candidatus Azotimanducaceae bacterium]|jgi:hypothetical protein